MRGAIFLLLLIGLGVGPAALAEPAPDFTLDNDDGEPVQLEAQRGKVVMVNFWASWCAPCRKEMPLLDELYDRHREEGFVLYGINLDQDREAARAFLEEVGVSFPVLYDPDSEVSREYRVNAMPTTVLIDREGEVRHVNRGYKEGDDDKYREQVRQLVEE